MTSKARVRRRRATLFAAAGMVAAAPSPASAHLVGVEFGDFYAGALHLLMAPDSVAALLALALAASAQRREAARWMLLGLPIGLAIGVGVSFAAPNAIEGGSLAPMVAISLAVPGLLGAAALPTPAAVLTMVAAAGGAVIGYVNGLSAQEGALDLWLFASGVASAGVVLGTLVIAVVVRLVGLASWASLVSRVVSSWIAAAGVVFFGASIAA